MSDNEIQTHVPYLSDSLTNQYREDDGDGEGPVQLATVSTEQCETTQQQCVSDQRMDQPEHTSGTVTCSQDERHKTVADVKEPVSTESDMTTQQQYVSDTRMDQSEHTSETLVCSQDERHETVADIEATDSVPPCTLELIHDQSLDRSTVGAAQQGPPLLSSIVTGIGDQQSHNFSAPTLPTEYVQSPLSENPPGSEQGLSSNQHPRELQTFATSSPDIMSLPSSPEVVQIEETNESDSGRSSPYLFLHKHTMADASKFESAGLLYARATVDRHNRYEYRASSHIRCTHLSVFPPSSSSSSPVFSLPFSSSPPPMSLPFHRHLSFPLFLSLPFYISFTLYLFSPSFYLALFLVSLTSISIET